MNYNLGLIGHPDTNKRIGEVIRSYFEEVNLNTIDIVDEDDFYYGVKKAKNLNKRCDGILYTARDIYYIFNNKFEHSIPNIYIENTREDIFRALFKGAYHLQGDMKKLSVDSLSYDAVAGAYADLGIGEADSCSIKVVEGGYTEEGFVKRMVETHFCNYRYDGSICITQITAVKEALEKKGVDVVLIENSREQVVEKVNRLLSRKLARNYEPDKVVVNIKLSSLKENIVIEESQHSVMCEYSRIMEEVFWFAERVEGAYSYEGNKSYMIYCSKESFEEETEYFSKLGILERIAEKQVVYGSIGVGYGRNYREAMKHSVIANIRAVNEGRNSAYIAYRHDDIVGPVVPAGQSIDGSSRVFDRRLKQVADKTSINLNTLYKINSLLQKSGGSSFTSLEVAEAVGVTRRSANRILERLEVYGYAEPVSMKSDGSRGRPSRLMRFLF